MFLQEPKNVTVAERMDAFFAYSYRGTSGVPSWRINDTVFVISALPPKHSYNGSGLVVNSVDLSLNMTSYTCFFSGTLQLEEESLRTFRVTLDL